VSDLAKWAHEEASRAVRLGERARTEEKRDACRDYAEKLNAIGNRLIEADRIFASTWGDDPDVTPAAERDALLEEVERFKERLVGPDATVAMAYEYYENPTGSPEALMSRLARAAVNAAERAQVSEDA
jgi:hypothetical protein